MKEFKLKKFYITNGIIAGINEKRTTMFCGTDQFQMCVGELICLNNRNYLAGIFQAVLRSLVVKNINYQYGEILIKLRLLNE